MSSYYFSPLYLFFGSEENGYTILLTITVILYPCNMLCCVMLCGVTSTGNRFESSHPDYRMCFNHDVRNFVAMSTRQLQIAMV